MLVCMHNTYMLMCLVHLGEQHQIADFRRDYLSVWCLNPRRGLAIGLCLTVEGRLKESRAMRIMSALLSVEARLWSCAPPPHKNPCPQSFLSSGIHGHRALQSPHPSQTLPHPRKQLPLGWVIVHEGGGNTRPREVRAWNGMKWLQEKERDRLWTFI